MKKLAMVMAMAFTLGLAASSVSASTVKDDTKKAKTECCKKDKKECCKKDKKECCKKETCTKSTEKK